MKSFLNSFLVITGIMVRGYNGYQKIIVHFNRIICYFSANKKQTGKKWVLNNNSGNNYLLGLSVIS